MGSGKTSVGRTLSDFLNKPFIDLDDEIEKQQKLSIAEIFNQKGEDFFRNIEAKTIQSITDNAIVSLGGGTPCYCKNLEWILENGKLVYLETSEKILFERVMNEIDKRPKLHQLEGHELQAHIVRLLKIRKPYYEKAQIVVKTDNKNPAEIALEIKQYLA